MINDIKQPWIEIGYKIFKKILYINVLKKTILKVF
jgi:hypothetical protein